VSCRMCLQDVTLQRTGDGVRKSGGMWLQGSLVECGFKN